MRIVRSILSLTLAVALLASGLPVSIFEDADRDRDIDLQDAVQLVRSVADTAENPADFKEAFQRAVSALHVVAGIKTVIQASTDNAPDTGTIFSSSLFLLSSDISSIGPTNFYFTLGEGTIDFESLTVAPPLPPPESC